MSTKINPQATTVVRPVHNQETLSPLALHMKVLEMLVTNPDITADMLLADIDKERLSLVIKEAIRCTLWEADRVPDEPSNFRIITLGQIKELLSNLGIELTTRQIGSEMDNLVLQGAIKRHPYIKTKFAIRVKELDTVSCSDPLRQAIYNQLLPKRLDYKDLDVPKVLEAFKVANGDSQKEVTEKDVRVAVGQLIKSGLIGHDRQEEASEQKIELTNRFQSTTQGDPLEIMERFEQDVFQKREVALAQIFLKSKQVKVHVESGRWPFKVSKTNTAGKKEEADIIIRDASDGAQAFLGIKSLNELLVLREQEWNAILDRYNHLESKLADIDRLKHTVILGINKANESPQGGIQKRQRLLKERNRYVHNACLDIAEKCRLTSRAAHLRRQNPDVLSYDIDYAKDTLNNALTKLTKEKRDVKDDFKQVTLQNERLGISYGAVQRALEKEKQ